MKLVGVIGASEARIAIVANLHLVGNASENVIEPGDARLFWRGCARKRRRRTRPAIAVIIEHLLALRHGLAADCALRFVSHWMVPLQYDSTSAALLRNRDRLDVFPAVRR